MSDLDGFIASLNDDLQTEFQSVVQYVQHTAMVTGPEYLSTATN
jgi:bacterioferritin